MPIFGAKSRAARGCASKLACGRRIDPHAAHPFLRYVAAKLPLPYGRTEASAPTGHGACSLTAVAIMQLCPAGESAASTATGVLRCRRLAVRFCACILRGRGRTPPLRSRGKFYGFALARSNLQVRTAQSFRHGFAVPPPFTQGRLWCVLQIKTAEGIISLPAVFV